MNEVEVPPIQCRHCGRIWGPKDRRALADTPRGKVEVCADPINGTPSCYAGLTLQVYGEKLGERRPENA